MAPLPVIPILQSVMTAQSYLRAATNASLPPVITGQGQYGPLVTSFVDWQEELWTQFWEGLVDTGVVAAAAEVNTLFHSNLADAGVINGLLYDDDIPIAVAQCNDVANLITSAQPMLEQLEEIAASIEGADQAKVDAYTALVAQLQDQFNAQEDKLTQDALDSATEIVSTAIDVGIAIGSEGEDTTQLIEGVIKLGTTAIDELALTAAIKETLGQLEDAWAALDQASADLAQITHCCKQLKTVTDQTAATLTALDTLSTAWNSVAATTTLPADQWESEGCAALRQWAAQMVKLSFGNATQRVTTSTVSAA
ncbi:hypothetical protein GVO57_08620 [Sphingomonas changnyeongensis]|uniref:Uncharacterized protein n=1 Tax=Sphingomonas changnyeongensis TaxID=2698679 RepID=A0A7Z2S9L1_9SPHN|nr:hypothetical protein [Sphingomonas changnyeongensis]QHL90869.1 hypothetical protein GVO57_08620 [Sphingomonas changnyeongensis]